jgi:hypothetical protein
MLMMNFILGVLVGIGVGERENNRRNFVDLTPFLVKRSIIRGKYYNFQITSEDAVILGGVIRLCKS